MAKADDLEFLFLVVGLHMVCGFIQALNATCLYAC